MHVGIQESEHFEGVYPVIRLFDNGQNKISLFVNRYVREKLLDLLGDDASNYHWVVQEDSESTFHFCRRMRQEILSRNIQLVYLNTISKHHLWYAVWLPFSRIRTILTVHDVNCMFKSRIGFRPRAIAQFLGKRWLRNKVSAFNTVSETVKPYLEKQCRKDQEVYTIPGAVFDQELVAEPIFPPLRIVVPGSIDPKRRDYGQVLELAKLLSSDPVEIVLLGGGSSVYATSIWQQCKVAGLPNLVWFEKSIIPQDRFDEWLNKAHFIWIPSVIETEICDGIREVYGITKSSGNIFDIIKHARPFLYPEGLIIPAELAQSGYPYASIEKLSAWIRQVLETPTIYPPLLKSAESASEAFTVGRLRSRFSELLS